MQVTAIQQQINQKSCINYKGSVDNSVAKFVNACAKDESLKYIKTLSPYATADIAVLQGIKNKWSDMLQFLTQKAKLMHKDTVMKFDYETKRQGMDTFTQKGSLRFYNSKLDKTVDYKSLYSAASYSPANFVSYKEFEKLANEMSSQDIDQKILKSAIDDVELTTKYSSSYDVIESKVNNIIEYKAEIGDSENADFLNMIHKNIRLNAEKDAQNNVNEPISKQNKELFHKVFK